MCYIKFFITALLHGIAIGLVVSIISFVFFYSAVYNGFNDQTGEIYDTNISTAIWCSLAIGTLIMTIVMFCEYNRLERQTASGLMMYRGGIDPENTPPDRSGIDTIEQPLLRNHNDI